MTEDERVTAALIARLRGEMATDRALVARCVADAQLARGALAVTPADHAALALAAVALHAWYTGVETILERTARALDREVPEGERWHRELLAQASVEVPGLRPAIVPAALTPDLAELLSFRHFFRHAYGILLDPVRIGALLDALARVEPHVGAALDAFDAFLASAAPR
ncbi:MAG: hypothetical protein HYS27_24660 [Deltaproteobacteria bacterium]|nr:hypothetical protein [Deltaproteobacteria bacterium]